MKKLLFILTILCVSCLTIGLVACGNGNGDGGNSGDANTVVIEGITYTLDNETDTYSITSSNIESSIITIPEEVEGKKVVAIGAEAFRGSKLLKEITLPSTVKEIGYAAFRGTTKLQKINLENVEVIGNDAFRESFSTNNTNIKMSNLKSLGTYAFSSSTKLREVDMTGATLSSIPESCFESCSLLYKVKLSQSIKTIWKRAFAGDSCIVEINLQYVEYLKANCFENCKNITSITLTNVKDIRNEAFMTCSKLTTVTIGNNVERIYQRAFFETAVNYFEIGNGAELTWGYYSLGGVTGATKDGTLRNYIPLWALGDEDAQAQFDPTNPSHWATMMVLNYNTGYFICTQKWATDRGYENGQKFAWDFFLNQA